MYASITRNVYLKSILMTLFLSYTLFFVIYIYIYHFNRPLNLFLLLILYSCYYRRCWSLARSLQEFVIFLLYTRVWSWSMAVLSSPRPQADLKWPSRLPQVLTITGYIVS